MNLPFILDVIISLIFIYLILSLLASEIQELVTTVLQWRARHLRDSIETLLSGGGPTAEQQKVKSLVNSIYDDPLIRNLNQEAKGLAARGFRLLSQWLFPGNRKGAFGENQASGPSYISPDSFATALLERLGLSSLLETLVEERLDQFVQRIIGDVTVSDSGIALQDPSNPVGLWTIAQNCGVDLSQDRGFYHLVEDLQTIQQDFHRDHITVKICLDRLSESFDRFLSSYSEPLADETAYFLDRAYAFKLGLFGKPEDNNARALFAAGLEPTLADISALLDKSSTVYKTVARRYEAMTSQALAITEQINHRASVLLEQRSGLDAVTMTPHQPTEEERQACLDTAISELDDTSLQIYQDYQVYQRAKHAIDQLPPAVKESMSVLARRAQIQVQSTTNTVNLFQQEVAQWFDRSMERAGGVYKRNAKGVAIVIGILLAMGTNADTFHIFSRLSSDESLRKVIVDRASQIQPQDTRPDALRQDLEALKAQTEDVLMDIPLPISWSPNNLSRQLGCPYEPSSTDLPGSEEKIYSLLTRAQWNDLYKACLATNQVPEGISVPIQVAQMIAAKPLGFLRMVSGWLISGLAIAMGAPFWFDLLGKLVNVRNAGSKPKSAPAPTSSQS